MELGLAGKQVVRLKGGDPFVFGRGGEEAEALVEAGVRFEVVPGVTAGVAAPAYAGIPVTHRDLASAVAFVTGHEDPSKDESALDWDALARFPGTLVLYMGVKSLGRVAERLMAAGRDPSEPAAVVERGTLPGQRSVAAPLSEIAERAAAAGVRPPAIVADRACRRPARHRSPGSSGGRFTARWWRSRALARRRAGWPGGWPTWAPRWWRRRRSGSSRAWPTPRSPEAVSRSREYALVCFTSPNGVRLLFDALAGAGHDARAFAGATVAAIGPGTAAELARRGILADVVPRRSVAEALVEALVDVPVEGRAVLVARAAEARDVLPDALRERGARVSDVALYDTVAEPLDRAAPGAARARHLRDLHLQLHGALLHRVGRARAGRRARVVSIGPVTSATARELGLTVHVEAERHDIDGLVDALLADAAHGRAR